MQIIGKCMLTASLLALMACSQGVQAEAESSAARETKPAASRAGSSPVKANQSSEEDAKATSSAEELHAHVPEGSTLIDSVGGDLNGDGRPDALLVLDTGNGDERLGEGVPRTVVLLVRDASGTLQPAKRNERLVPCETCGGVAGDPYGYVRIDKDRFTVAVGGGSRERWSDDYTFTYANGGWYVDKIVRSVVDMESGKQKRKEFTPRELGELSFEDLDPSKLEQVAL
ncbi:hypothetical protein [Lysobacter sp.]|uniref:hypothetical protein n=1 Tax=Lysobacter sp. TaxID=72226 RepID=UPI002D6FC31D|nr:hypothetical protein [Lysobacter sp.]HZX78973.1 hypothetical protein [Lysobacter sp.]